MQPGRFERALKASLVVMLFCLDLTNEQRVDTAEAAPRTNESYTETRAKRTHIFTTRGTDAGLNETSRFHRGQMGQRRDLRESNQRPFNRRVKVMR